MNSIIDWIAKTIINIFDFLTFWKDWDTFTLVFAVALLVLIYIAYYFLKQEYSQPVMYKKHFRGGRRR